MTPEPRANTVRPGDVLAGKYRVERVLGSGGMGMVVEATHLVLEERVALKFLLPHVLESPESGARFLREAKVAARLRSPHVVRVHDVGELESGAPYIVMELLSGESLDDLLEREGKLEPERACSLLLQACEALAAAHAAGVIHRDLKPANLFLTHSEDGSPLLKVVDFGISKVAPIDASTEGSITRTQVSMGSPLYMSPEQMRSARDVDLRTDIWALGVVLYRCLAGRAPFEAESLPQICALVLDGDATPLRELVPELPESLERVVTRCLSVKPSDRFSDVVELAEELAPHADPADRGRAARCRRILTAAGMSLAPSVLGPAGSKDSSTTDSDLGTKPRPGSGTGISFAGTGVHSIPPSTTYRRNLIVLGALAGLTLLGVVGLVVTRNASAPAATSSVAASTAPSVTPTPVGAVEVSPEPNPASATSTAASSAPPPSIVVLPTARVPPRAPTTARPTTARPPTTAKPAATPDPFADRK